MQDPAIMCSCFEGKGIIIKTRKILAKTCKQIESTNRKIIASHWTIYEFFKIIQHNVY